MEESIIETLGLEIIGVIAPVSICMFLVVLLVNTITPQGSESPISTAATLVYTERPTDSNMEKLEGAILNAVVFVIMIAAVTFLLVLLYYYRCTNFLKNYMRFSTFIILGSMGGSIFLSIIQHFSIPIDVITCSILLYNFCIVGTLSVFSKGIPIVVRQFYMIIFGVIVAAWFTKLPEWTTWVMLVALALYDLVAVLAPGGPLKLLVELASSREEDLPALVYEARPTVSRHEDSSLNLLFAGVSPSMSSGEGHPNSGVQSAVELQPARSIEEIPRSLETGESLRTPYEERSSDGTYISRRNAQRVERFPSRPSVTQFETDVEEASPLVGRTVTNMEHESHVMEDAVMETSQGIKLGLGDFVFYSVLVGRAAMYDLMTVYACYVAIICGLGCTLILLSICHHALPALPISITLGVVFYFLTRFLMEPFAVGTATRLMMF